VVQELRQSGLPRDVALKIVKRSQERVKTGVAGAIEASEFVDAATSPGKLFAWGIGLIVLGFGLSVGSYLAASPGGLYIIFFGKMIFGLWLIVRGIRISIDRAQ
jgi:hypothetical protein